MSSLHNTASWVIVDKDTGRAIYETYNKDLVKKLNLDLFKAVPVLEYLQDFNRRVAEAGGVQPS